MNRIDRLFAILLVLQLRRRVTARTIAAEFGISERTVYRDMRALGEMGVPIAAQAGEGYELLEGFSLPPIALTGGEARAIAVGMQAFLRNSAGQMHRDAATSLHKIMTALSPPLRDQTQALMRVVDTYPAHEPIDWEQPAIRLFLEAIDQRRVVAIEYQGYQADEVTRRDIEPARLTFSSGAGYVEAFCRLRSDLRSFRISRMKSAVLRDETFLPRIVVAGKPALINVQVRFADAVLPYVREQQHYGFVREVDGLMCYQVGRLSEIRGWILGFGAQAVVEQPDELRRWLIEECQRLIKLLT